MSREFDLSFINFIHAPHIKEYRWEGAELFIWVNNYDYSDFIGEFKKICSLDEGGIKAWLQEDCVGISLDDTDLLEEHYDELQAAFPPDGR